MLQEELEKNFKYVKNNFDSLLNFYRNKFVLINKEEVVGSFDNYQTAAEEGINTYGLEAGFLVHFITDELQINFIAHSEI